MPSWFRRLPADFAVTDVTTRQISNVQVGNAIVNSTSQLFLWLIYWPMTEPAYLICNGMPALGSLTGGGRVSPDFAPSRVRSECDGTSRETDRNQRRAARSKSNCNSPQGEDSEVTVANYHCSALFVFLSHVRYEIRQHGCFGFRLASVARSGT